MLPENQKTEMTYSEFRNQNPDLTTTCSRSGKIDNLIYKQQEVELNKQIENWRQMRGCFDKIKIANDIFENVDLSGEQKNELPPISVRKIILNPKEYLEDIYNGYLSIINKLSP